MKILLFTSSLYGLLVGVYGVLACAWVGVVSQIAYLEFRSWPASQKEFVPYERFCMLNTLRTLINSLHVGHW